MCIRDSQVGDRAPVDCKNVLALMSLGARQGDSLVITVQGIPLAGTQAHESQHIFEMCIRDSP